MAKKVLYPHNPRYDPNAKYDVTKGYKSCIEGTPTRQVSKISSKIGGKPFRQEIYNLDEIDEYLRARFNTGATRIILYWDTEMTVEWALVE